MKKLLFLPILLLLLFTACKGSKVTEEAETPVDYTIVPRGDIPQALLETVDGVKAEAMTMTYGENGYLYIVVGYGVMPTGGYSISVEKLCQTSGEIHVRTNLRGPAAGEAVNKTESHPYIVLKIEYTEKKVVFE